MLIDAHSHLDRYDLISEQALASALDEITQHQIFTVSTSMDLPSYERNLNIAEICDLVLPTFGVHPWNAPEYAHRLDELDDAIARSPMLGEVGLDFYFVKDAAAHADQKRVFEHFLAAAQEQAKIVNLHTKGAEAATLELLERYEVPGVIVHWYSGPRDILEEFVARGAYLTVNIAARHSEQIRAIARKIPDEQLLTETDNPGGPQSLLGRPGTPTLLQEVVQTLAEIRKTTVEVITQTVQANFLTLIRDDPRLAATYAGLLEEE